MRRFFYIPLRPEILLHFASHILAAEPLGRSFVLQAMLHCAVKHAVVAWYSSEVLSKNPVSQLRKMMKKTNKF